MKTFFSIVFKLVLFVAGFWILISFLQWDESDRSNAVLQMLPYELNYSYEGEAKSYKDGNAWYARLYKLSESGDWVECHNHLIGLYDYEKLKMVADKVPSSKRSYVVARVFQTKSTGSDRCEVAVGDWDQFSQMAQPDDKTVREFNKVKQAEHAAN